MVWMDAGMRLGTDVPMAARGTAPKAFFLMVWRLTSDSKSTNVSVFEFSNAMSPM